MTITQKELDEAGDRLAEEHMNNSDGVIRVATLYKAGFDKALEIGRELGKAELARDISEYTADHTIQAYRIFDIVHNRVIIAEERARKLMGSVSLDATQAEALNEAFKNSLDDKPRRQR